MKKQVFDVMMKLSSPNKFTTKNLDFREKYSDIFAAMEYFNYKCANKKVRILDVKVDYIQVRLDIVSKDGDMTPIRQLSAMSRYLYSKCGWSKYSNLKHRLFYIYMWQEKEYDQYSIDAVLNEKQRASKAISDEEMLNFLGLIVKNQEIGDKERKKKILGEVKSILLRYI